MISFLSLSPAAAPALYRRIFLANIFVRAATANAGKLPLELTTAVDAALLDAAATCPSRQHWESSE